MQKIMYRKTGNEKSKSRKKEAELELQREKELLSSLLPHRFCAHSEKADD